MAFLSGNEAIAQGVWEAGAHIGVAYPGTPSTETMEEFAKKEGVYAEWAPNEKVAVEVAIGASAGGARVLATMKHVGVNVAADPLFTVSYTGVNGGMPGLALLRPCCGPAHIRAGRFRRGVRLREGCIRAVRAFRHPVHDALDRAHEPCEDRRRGGGAHGSA